MREDRESHFEVFEEYGGFKQHDLVSGVYQGKDFHEGEVKSFTKNPDTGEVVANITATHNSVGIFGDIHIDPSLLKLKFRMGKAESPVFKLGKAKKN